MARQNEINCLENIKNVLAGKTSINIYKLLSARKG